MYIIYRHIRVVDYINKVYYHAKKPGKPVKFHERITEYGITEIGALVDFILQNLLYSITICG